MARPPKKDIMPAECCGVCALSHREGEFLACYAMPPQFMQDENSDVFTMRGAIVDELEPICHLFKPRMHA